MEEMDSALQVDGMESVGSNMSGMEGDEHNTDMHSVSSARLTHSDSRSCAMSVSDSKSKLEQPENGSYGNESSHAEEQTIGDIRDKEGKHEWEMEAEYKTLTFKAVEMVKGWHEL
ncbi:hypothetical protein B0H10DRAFT_1947822 [Mycena sp. CBHHK59/15]|nr:hypothetical protein B0H10DRAFT_1947822 [Mycena sp. CBHHK59/15]